MHGCKAVLCSSRLADLRNFILKWNDITSLGIVEERHNFTNAVQFFNIFELF